MDIPRKPPNRLARKVLSGVGVGAFIVLTVTLAVLDPPPPVVQRSSIWIDTARVGEMIREVRGTGTLVPVYSVLIASSTGGTVERILVENGTAVTAGTPLLELGSPEIARDAEEATRELIELEAQAVIERTRYEEEALNLETALADARRTYTEAIRTTEVDRQFLTAGVLPESTAQRITQERADNATQLFLIEERRIALQTQRLEAQRQSDLSALARRRAAALQRSQRTRGLLVTAEIDGIVQGIALDIGQSVGAHQMLGRIVEPDRLKAVLRIPEVQVRDVIVGQPTQVDTRLGIVPGRVSRVDPSVAQGTVAVDIVFDQPLPQGVRPDLGVDGVIEIERIEEVLRVGRPTSAATDRTIRIFRIAPDGTTADRVEVAIGRTSIGTVEVLRGLQEGDVIILSDMSEWADHDQVRLR